MTAPVSTRPSPAPVPPEEQRPGRRTSELARWRPGPPLLGLLAGWVALFAWSNMVAEPLAFLVPTVLIGLLMALAGSGLRVLRVPAYAVAATQALLGLLSLNVVFASRWSLLGLIPTEDSLRQLFYVIGNGAATLNTYSAPVTVNPTHTQALLTSCGLAVLFAIDVLAFGLRRPALVALPLLVTLSVPVSILTDALTLPVFIGTTLLFLRLLAVEHVDRLGGWATSGGRRDAAGRRSDRRPPRARLTVMWQVSVAALLTALVVAPLVPVADLLNRNEGTGEGLGGNGAFRLTAINPFVKLRRDLVEQTNTPLLFADTDAADTGYLRTTVLDQFRSDSWRPSPRSLPKDNSADGTFPNPPGLGPGLGGTTSEWKLTMAPGFGTTWLPLPYPLRELDVEGDWRYDSRTLDVANVGGSSAPELSYDAVAFAPRVTARVLQSSAPAPARLRTSMTALPDDLPEVVTTRAEEVTEGARTDFEKAVALQDWFRSEGGFTYSLEQRSGSGMELLADFITDDRIGYCEQFAAAMAAMGRALNIPSRVVVGFLDGTTQSDGRVLYTSDDRHAWPEMYFSGIGWVRFEPTPGQRAGATPAWTRQDLQVPDTEAAPTDEAAPTQAPGADAAAADEQGSDGGPVSIPAWPVVALAIVVLVGVAPGVVRRLQRQRRLAAASPTHLAEGAWSELRATALDLGLEWPEQRSPRQQARSMVDQVQAEDDDVTSLETLLVDLERSRYARAGAGTATVDPTTRARTVETVESWRRAMLGSVDRQRGWRGRLWPVSLVPGRRR